MKPRFLPVLVFLCLATTSLRADAVRNDRLPAESPQVSATVAVEPDHELHQRKLEEILDRPQYQRWRLWQARAEAQKKSQLSQSVADELERLLRWILDSIVNLLRKIGSSTPSATPSNNWLFGLTSFILWIKIVGWIVLAGMLVFLGIWLFRYTRRLQPHQSKARILSRERVQQALESGEALALQTPQWMSEANRLEREQDIRMVYRAMYLALLSGLHSAGKIDFRLSRTNWVYVTHYRGPVTERDLFSSLTEVFDHVWYGHEPADADRVEELRLTVIQLTNSAAPASPTTPRAAGGR